ncbi:MAG: FtsX-like permease family protein [Pseudomonadales bacterium]|nr:FtsX-like permease family protein [Pseudomonadales bacterium]
MELGPILRALTRNRLGVILIALQIAFTMTVVVNALFIINDRGERMGRPSGIDEANLFYLRSIGFGNNYNEAVSVAEDLAMLRQLPGIVDATFINSIPLSDSGSSGGFMTEPGKPETLVAAALYRVDAHAVQTMNLDLVAGENFSQGEIRERPSNENTFPDNVIITAALAEKLFPGEGLQAVGRTIFTMSDKATRISGIVRQLQAPWVGSDFIEQSILLPENTIDGNVMYLIRAEPGQRDRLMAEIEERLAASNPDRILRDLRSLEQTRERSYRIDSAMSQILYAVIGTLIFITAMGIVGLAVFSINRRRRQIGTRRALGASQGEILRYFLLENVMITGTGVLVGAVLTIGFNIFLVQTFNMPRLDWYYTPLGMLVLVLVGQLAVIGPSRSAARIPPAVATRSV